MLHREGATNCDADNFEFYGCLNKGCHIIAPVLKLENFRIMWSELHENRIELYPLESFVSNENLHANFVMAEEKKSCEILHN